MVINKMADIFRMILQKYEHFMQGGHEKRKYNYRKDWQLIRNTGKFREFNKLFNNILNDIKSGKIKRKDESVSVK